MRASATGSLLTAFASVVFSATLLRAQAGFDTVDFSSQANFTWAGVDSIPGEATAVRLPGAPIGPTTLGGIPFNITSNANGKQAWHGDLAANGGNDQVSITMDVNIYDASDVYTLINTWGGQSGPTSYAWITFTGSGGANYTKQLIGNVDIRDYNNDGWTNSINGTTTVNVFNVAVDNWNLPGRLDLQDIALPAAFANQYLTTITLVDNGGVGLQRVVLDGVTVGAVPEPAALTLFGLALVSLGGFRWLCSTPRGASRGHVAPFGAATI